MRPRPPPPPIPRRLALPAALLLLAVGTAPLRAEEAPEEPAPVPVRVAAAVDEREAADLGLWRLTLTFHVEEDVTRPLRVQLRATSRSRVVLDLDHAPRPPTSTWRKGQRIVYDLPFPVPDGPDAEPGAYLDLLLAFEDPDERRPIPPRTEEVLWYGALSVARLEIPVLAPTDPPEAVTRILARADEMAKAGRRPDAWRLLETALRRAEEDATKRRFRDGLLALAPREAEPPSVLEEQIVAERIADERLRHLREVAGREFDRGHLFASLRLLEEIGGSLAEQANTAVIGALADAKRAEKDILDLQVRILARATDEDKERARKAVEHLGVKPPLLEKAKALLAEKQYARARLLFRELALSSDRALAGDGRRLLEECERAWLADTPEDEAKVVEEARRHPAFARVAVVPTQKFLLLGPKGLVETIPPDSRLRFDVAYVFLTDLFGRRPNPSGDRVTVFFKELWDFGGGVGGGKTIDIGKADPKAVGTRVDTGLLYHELTHCVDDTEPIYAGFREGLANFGAAYAFEAIGQGADTLHAFATNLEAFRRDYLGRDVAYWRIQNYGPSAGFFLHFVDKYARVPGGHDWKPYRRFFRAYRQAPVKDGRETCVTRALAHYLMLSFGPGALDDLVAFRFPLEESDRAILAAELEAFERGEAEVLRREEEYRRHPNSPLPRDLVARRMLSLAGRPGSEEEVREVARELGIVTEWQVIGPFKSAGADPRARIFPPEVEIDLAKEYTEGLNTCKWRRAEAEGVVSVDPTGWVTFGFSYQEDTATYALTYLTVPRDTEALVHLRTDDDFALWLDDRRVEGYVQRGEVSHQYWFRGPVAKVPDMMRLPVVLAAGRHKLLLKVRNRAGPAGFVLAVSDRAGRAIEGLVADAVPPGATTVAAPAKAAWKEVLDLAFRAKGGEGRFDTAVGRFKVANRRLAGDATDKQVAWRKYTVRPGFPADNPSNLLWLKAKTTEGLGAFRLQLDLLPPAKQAPKVAVIFQGEGGDDAFGGWTLVVHPAGEGKVAAQLERYEDLVYQLPPTDLPPEVLALEEVPLVLAYQDDRLTVTLGDVPLFQNVSILPIPGRHRIGLATWGREPGIAALELREPGR